MPSSPCRMRSVAPLFAACLLLLTTPATGFDSYGKKEPEHDQITRAAAAAKGFGETSITRLQREVRTVDWNETETVTKMVKVPVINKSVPRPFLQTSDAYHYSHHFDRGKKDATTWRTVLETFESGRTYAKQQNVAAIISWKLGLEDEAFRLLGEGLHALEDLASHSNALDLGAADQASLIDSIFDHTIAMPGGLKLTSFLEKDTEGGNNAGDPLDYQHDLFSKDSPKKNAEAQAAVGSETKFDLAKALGTSLAERFLQEFLDGLNGAEQTAAKAFDPVAPHVSEGMYKWRDDAQFTPGAPLVLGVAGTSVAFDAAAFSTAVELSVLNPHHHFFKEMDDITNHAGQTMAVFREIRTGDLEPLSPIQAEIIVDIQEIEYVDPSSFGVFYMDPFADDWLPVSGANVFESAGGVVAQFDMHAAGVYAIGGIAAFEIVPEPGSAAIFCACCWCISRLSRRGAG